MKLLEHKNEFVKLERVIADSFVKGQEPTLLLYDDAEGILSEIHLHKKSNKGWALYLPDGKRFKLFSWIRNTAKDFPQLDSLKLDLGALDISFSLKDKEIGFRFDLLEFFENWKKRRQVKKAIKKRGTNTTEGLSYNVDIFRKNKF